MTGPLPQLPSPREWLTTAHTNLAAGYFIDRAAEHDDMHLVDLADDALDTLGRCRHIALRYGDRRTQTACDYAGHYDWNPPTIEVTKSSSRARDNFTALHEYGHHLQRHDDDWVLDVLTSLGEFERTLLEENVANAFAARALISDAELRAAVPGTVTAAQVAELHRHSSASRTAVIRRVVDDAADPVLVVVSDYFGKVIAAHSNTDALIRPARESVQPDLARLTATVDGVATVRGHTQAGLLYSTGSARSDLTIELHPDHDGAYYFSVIRPMYRFGTQQWDEELVECVNEACGRTFTPTANTMHFACGAHRCPFCHRCGCSLKASASCPHCGLELSLADVAAGATEHDVC